MGLNHSLFNFKVISLVHVIAWHTGLYMQDVKLYSQ